MSAESFWIDAAFFIPKTPARRAVIARMLKDLKLVKAPKSKHVLSYSFGSETPGGRSVNVHIDESKYEDDPVNYYVQMHLHGGDPDHEATERFDVEWAFKQILALCKGADTTELLFMNAEMLLPGPPPPSSVVAVPLSIGGRILPVIGVEYGTELGDGVDSFRWTRSPEGIKINVSYSREYPIAEIPNLWERERVTVEAYAKEALPR